MNERLSDIVTAIEAAKYLKVSKATLLRLANRGVVPGTKIGRQWRFSKTIILKLFNNPDLLHTIMSKV